MLRLILIVFTFLGCIIKPKVKLLLLIKFKLIFTTYIATLSLNVDHIYIKQYRLPTIMEIKLTRSRVGTRIYLSVPCQLRLERVETELHLSTKLGPN